MKYKLDTIKTCHRNLRYKDFIKADSIHATMRESRIFILTQNRSRFSVPSSTSLWSAILLVVLYLSQKSSNPSSIVPAVAVMAFAAASSSSTPMTTTGKKECAVVGVGVLGTSLCRQLLESPEFKDWKITGITKTTNRHSDIMEQVSGGKNMRENNGDDNERFSLTTMDEVLSSTSKKKYQHCVFCAPPSGFDDYTGAVRVAANELWAGRNGGGAFVFTSSGGIYGPGDSTLVTVTEDSPIPDPVGNPRSERLQSAESVVKEAGGTSLRLAGLYTLERGAHNFWLVGGKTEVGGRSDGLVNLLHYDDAAGSVVAALLVSDPSESIGGKVFLVSDGHPLTRQQICESSLKSKRYEGMKIPTFTGTKDDPIGKVYDGSYTNEVLKWKPRYPSFDEFMVSN